MPILTEDALNIKIPRLVKVNQKFNREKINNIEEAIMEQLLSIKKNKSIKPGSQVALLVGSRGINNLPKIVKQMGDQLKSFGAKPFIIPSMGSHGGGTAEGQIEVLKHLGIDEETMDMPIKSSMEVTMVGTTLEGVPVYVDNIALDTDLIIPIVRVKPHTDFKGKVESGICKMLAIGLGNHIGCSRLHQEGFDSFPKLIPEVAEIIINKVNIYYALTIIENALDETAHIELVQSKDILYREPILLEKAKELMPSLLLPKIDVLIIEKIGKDISGAGMDTNIIGRTAKGTMKGYKGPEIQRIVVLDLTTKTNGNATGLGLADFTTKKLFNKINYESTYANVIASSNPEGGRIPIICEDEKEALIAAIKCCSRVEPQNVKIVKIKNTLELGEVWVSENYSDYIEYNKRLEYST